MDEASTITITTTGNGFEISGGGIETKTVVVPPATHAAAEAPRGELFNSAAAADEVSFVPSSLNAKDRTVDVVWYGGATVPRMDPDTWEPYMLKLNMAGCRLDRLNAGAPVFDCHMSGLDFKSFMAEQPGSKAQRGSVVKAWADGAKGLATLQFGVEGENEDTDRLWSAIASGRVRNLSFGTYIYNKQPVTDANGNGMMAPHPQGKQAPVFEATDWEPFEISPVTVPADFSTEFLSALLADGKRAPSPPKGAPAMEQTQTGAEARTKEVLDAARVEGANLERQRVAEITAMAASFKLPSLATKLIASGATVDAARERFNTAVQLRTIGSRQHGLTPEFLEGVIETSETLDAGRTAMLDEMAIIADKTKSFPQVSVVRDGADVQAKRMEAALLLRYNPEFYGKTGKEVDEQRSMAREYNSYTLLDMGREFLESRGLKTRGMDKLRLAEMMLRSARMSSNFELFEGGAESSSDFPAILANVANKTLRQSYQAYPQTFKAFCRPVTASDFKPINRVQLSDAPALQALNEKGEYHHASLTDSNVAYQLATFGEIVALTRKTIINDDLQAFTRVPALLGVAAARLESDKVWAVITGNPSAQYAGDAAPVTLFHANHKNWQTGAPSAFSVTSLGSGRTLFRLQTAPQGTPLNLTPRYLVLPAALETAALQTIYPMQLAVTAVTAGVPEWVRSLVPITEPRLDAMATYGSTAWYLIADPADIDTIEYCYLEGQEGVYFETRQGFETDGIEMKARMDFAAAAIDYRSLQRSDGKA